MGKYPFKKQDMRLLNILSSFWRACAIPIAKFTDIIIVVQTNMQCVTELEKTEEDLNLNGWTVKDYMGARTQT